MGWIFQSKKRWVSIRISGSNHQSGIHELQTPNTPKGSSTSHSVTGTCLPARGIPPKSAAAQASWQVSGTEKFLLGPMARETRATGSWNLRSQQNPKENFEPKRDLPQRAELCVLYTSRELGEEGWGFLGFNELFLNFPVTTMSFRRQRHTG